MIHGPLVHCLRAPALSVKSIISARWKGMQYTERGMGETPSLTVCQKSLAEFARSRRQLCCHTDAACPLRVLCGAFD